MKLQGFILALSCLVLSACTFIVPDSGSLATPHIKEVAVTTVSEDGATLVASVSGERQVWECGFVVKAASGGAGMEIPAERRGGLFSAAAVGLDPDAEYKVHAFVGNGAGLRLDSPAVSFKTLPREQHPGQPQTPGQPEESQQPDQPGQPGQPELPATVSIIDANFLSWLLWRYDYDKDGALSPQEAAYVSEIEINTDNVESLEDLSSFPNLCRLSVGGTRREDTGLGLLAALDISKNGKLNNLYAPHNRISSLSLPQNTGSLDRIDLTLNELESIDIRPYGQLNLVSLSLNRLRSLDVSGLDFLDELHVDENPLETITLDNKVLRYIDLHSTNVTELDFSRCPMLNIVDCSDCCNLSVIRLAKGQVIGNLNVSYPVTIVYND